MTYVLAGCLVAAVAEPWPRAMEEGGGEEEEVEEALGFWQPQPQ